VKNVRTTCFSCVFSKFFRLWPEQFLLRVGDREAMQTKVTVKKPPKRAGATPLFRPRAAQKVIGVTPARFVQRQQMSRDSGRPKGERREKCPVHRPVHRGVHLDGQRNSRALRRMSTNRWFTLHAAKSLNWAGATPFWTAFSHSKFCGVAPACHAGSVSEFWPRARVGECKS
jgi:hypothetical protein